MKISMRVARVSQHFDPDGRRLWGYVLVPVDSDENRRLWPHRPDGVLELKFIVDEHDALDGGEYDVEINPKP